MEVKAPSASCIMKTSRFIISACRWLAWVPTRKLNDPATPRQSGETPLDFPSVSPYTDID
jgi:hypothetical protein